MNLSMEAKVKWVRLSGANLNRYKASGRFVFGGLTQEYQGSSLFSRREASMLSVIPQGVGL